MTFASLSLRCRTLAVLALCGGLAFLAGCAQTSPAQRSARTDNSADFSIQQGREIFAASFANMTAQDEFYENTLGVPRSVQSFAAFKEVMTATYTDPLVVDWLYAQLVRGAKRDEVFQELGVRMFRGIQRLDDTQSMAMLNGVAGMMGRLSAEQCVDFNRPKDGAEKSNHMARMLQWLTPEETRSFFGGLHQGMRAEFQGAPLRPAPTREQFTAMFAALGKEVPGGLFAKSEGNSCRDAHRLISAVSRLDGPVRSHAITYLLYTLGLAGRATPAKALA
ncbi:MAG: hypothetical protein ABW190_12150 [Rhizobacter sp.]